MEQTQKRPSTQQHPLLSAVSFPRLFAEKPNSAEYHKSKQQQQDPCHCQAHIIHISRIVQCIAHCADRNACGPTQICI